MTLVVCADPEKAALYVAERIQEEIVAKAELCLGLATGRTPARAYAELVRRNHQDPDFSFRNVTTFNTDEFVGVKPNDPRSARFFMNVNLFLLTDVCMENTHVPRGDAVDLEAECRGYEAYIKARGGVDLLVLGLGHNGHVGFNEPGSSLRSRTRVVEFTESTLAALSDGYRFRSIDETPRSAVSVGIATIMEARKVLLVATGLAKAEAVHRVFDRRPGSQVPASYLLEHPALEVVVDREAASTVRSPDVEIVHV